VASQSSYWGAVATKRPVEVEITVGAFVVLCAITFFCFVSGERIVKFLGPSGMSVITRMMGLILAVMGVQMAIDGIEGAFALT
jgi:multiple antibiotic resistance protein